MARRSTAQIRVAAERHDAAGMDSEQVDRFFAPRDIRALERQVRKLQAQSVSVQAAAVPQPTDVK